MLANVSHPACVGHRTLLDESDQRDLAPGIPLASSPAATTPLIDRLLAARRGDLAPGLPITPAPSSQMGAASGDLDLAPGAPITPAPSQALSSQMPTRAGSMPPAPPPTPSEVRLSGELLERGSGRVHVDACLDTSRIAQSCTCFMTS